MTTCTPCCRTLCVTFMCCCLEARAQPSQASGSFSDGFTCHPPGIKWATRWYGAWNPLHVFFGVPSHLSHRSTMLIPLFLCDAGVPAGGGAPASSDPPPPGSPAANRHAAAPLQGRPGEEALCWHEAGHLCHPGEMGIWEEKGFQTKKWSLSAIPHPCSCGLVLAVETIFHVWLAIKLML